MIRRLFRWITVLVIAMLVAFYWFTRPAEFSADRVADLSPDPQNGALVFIASGCGTCHAAPGSENTQILSGGREFPSPYGTFKAPNISSDPRHGIGRWTQAEFAAALLTGVSPNGRHYFPAFPYTSYAKMTPQDAVDLFGYMRTLPADATASQPHDIGFPFNIRRSMGLWKTLYLKDAWRLESDDPTVIRGRYLVEVLGHCAECHTPRNSLGGLNDNRWMQGAPALSGKGRVPAITPVALGWSAEEIVEYLTSGFTPEFDTAGGDMVDVIKNTSRLSLDDRQAIAAYLMALE